MDWDQVLIIIGANAFTNLLLHFWTLHTSKEFHGRLCALEEHFRSKHANRNH